MSPEEIPFALAPEEREAQPGENRRARRGRTGIGATAETDVVSPTPPMGTPTPTKPVKAAKHRADQLPIGGVPRVDLLPPELKAAREWRRARNKAVLLVLGAALVVLAASGAAGWWAALNGDQRTAAQARTTQLLAEQSEFVEVNQVQGAIAATERALAQASAGDVIWGELLTDLQGALPAGARITTVTIESSSPMQELAPPIDPLRTSRIASVTFSAVTTSVPDVVTWTRAVLDVPGVVYAAPRSTVADETASAFTVEMSVDISAERLRHQPEGSEPAEGSDAVEGATEEAQ